MIIIKLIGGLGNQMFQYAAGRRAAYVNNTQLKLDITGYDHQVGITNREYMLHIFYINEQFASQKEITACIKPVSFLSRIISRHTSSYVKEQYFHFDPKILKPVNNRYLEGYWPSEKYFLDIGSIIRKDFTLKNKPDKTNIALLKRISIYNSVSIHVRRSDYVSDQKTYDFHGVCGLDYYKKAISLIAEKTNNPHFFIFSDDPDWCKSNFRLQSSTIYVTHNLGVKDYEDMRLMSACKHNIIANSSFSWWGAWLNSNPNKIVMAPKKWFCDKSIDTKDLIPQDWIKI